MQATEFISQRGLPETVPTAEGETSLAIILEEYANPAPNDFAHEVRTITGICGVATPRVYEKTRKREVVEPRFMSMFVVHKAKGVGQEETGRIFGCIPSHVHYACMKTKELYQVDREFRRKLDAASMALGLQATMGHLLSERERKNQRRQP